MWWTSTAPASDCRELLSPRLPPSVEIRVRCSINIARSLVRKK